MNKKLLKRIRSLENFFGISYVSPDEKDYDGEHLTEPDYGLMYDLNKMRKEWQEKNKKDNKEDSL